MCSNVLNSASSLNLYQSSFNHLTVGLHVRCVQIKQLEDGLAAAQQSSAQLQTQLDAASLAAQSQATDLTSAQAQISQLRAESESLQSQLAEAQRDQQAAEEAHQTNTAAAADQAQQWTAKVSFIRCKFECMRCKLACPAVAAVLLSLASKGAQGSWACSAHTLQLV